MEQANALTVYITSLSAHFFAGSLLIKRYLHIRQQQQQQEQEQQKHADHSAASHPA
jgi:preprotein translocase subunit SecG